MTKEEIASILKKLRIRAGFTQTQVAEQINRKQQTVASWESAQSQPDADTLFVLCGLYGISVDEAFGFSKKTNIIADSEYELIKKYRVLDDHGKESVDSCLRIEYKRMEHEQKQRTPKLQIMYSNEEPEPEDNVFQLTHSLLDASAGTGYYLDGEQMVPWTVKYNELTRKADFSIDVNGSSMEPKFHDGDTLLIRQQPSVDIGEIGLYIVDGKGYVKQQGETCLISLNPDYEDIYPNEYSSVKCVGKVLGVLEPEWIVEK